MSSVLNKIVDGVKQAPEAVKNHVKKHPVIYGVITALFFTTLFLTGVGGAMALVGGHAAFAPHFMSAMNTAISGAWSGLPYAMTAAGGVGGAGLLGTAIMAIIIGGKKCLSAAATGGSELPAAATGGSELPTGATGGGDGDMHEGGGV